MSTSTTSFLLLLHDPERDSPEVESWSKRSRCGSCKGRGPPGRRERGRKQSRGSRTLLTGTEEGAGFGLQCSKGLPSGGISLRKEPQESLIGNYKPTLSVLSKSSVRLLALSLPGPFPLCQLHSPPHREVAFLPHTLLTPACRPGRSGGSLSYFCLFQLTGCGQAGPLPPGMTAVSPAKLPLSSLGDPECVD